MCRLYVIVIYYIDIINVLKIPPLCTHLYVTYTLFVAATTAGCNCKPALEFTLVFGPKVTNNYFVIHKVVNENI